MGSFKQGCGSGEQSSAFSLSLCVQVNSHPKSWAGFTFTLNGANCQWGSNYVRRSGGWSGLECMLLEQGPLNLSILLSFRSLTEQGT